jgi:hypothetical protein
LLSLFEREEFEVLAERLELRAVASSQPEQLLNRPEQLRREWMSVSGDAGILTFDEHVPAFSSVEGFKRWDDLARDAREWLAAKARPPRDSWSDAGSSRQRRSALRTSWRIDLRG